MNKHSANGRPGLRGVIFDLDGVIIDSHPIHKRAWKTLLESAGKTVGDSELEYVVEGQRREDILRHFFGDLTPDELRHYGNRKEHLFRELALDVAFVPGFLEFFGKVEAYGCPAAIASSAASQRVAFILDRLQIRSRFKTIVTADDVCNGKPDPEVFQRAAHEMGLDGTSSLVVEDAVNGVKAAKTAGMKCLAVASSDERIPLLQAAGADLVVTDYKSVQFETLLALFA